MSALETAAVVRTDVWVLDNFDPNVLPGNTALPLFVSVVDGKLRIEAYCQLQGAAAVGDGGKIAIMLDKPEKCASHIVVSGKLADALEKVVSSITLSVKMFHGGKPRTIFVTLSRKVG